MLFKSGIKFEVNSPTTLISSSLESPRFIVPPLKVVTPISSDVPSTFKLSFTNKSLPTNKSPPVVVIPPLELSVDIPVTINESKVTKPSSNIEFEVIVTPVPTFN